MKKKEIIKPSVPAYPGFVPTPKITMAGRPSTYSPRNSVERARKYVKDCIEKGKTPYAEQLALLLGVSGRTVKNWSEDEEKPEFGEIFQILLTVQKLDLKQKSLTGEYVSPIARLLLSAEHNVVEKMKQELTGEDGKPVEFQQKLSPEDRKLYSDQITKIFNKIYSKPHGQ